jgi:hypothetical protein
LDDREANDEVAILIAAAATLLAAPASAQSPVADDEIRAAFVGKAACPPQPWGVGFGPFEFRPDGVFVQVQDIASRYGRYAIADGRICTTFSGPSPSDFCVEVLKDGAQYFFREVSPPVRDTPRPPIPVTPCPLPDGPR